MNANQQNQVYQIVAGNGLQSAPFGLPVGVGYDPNKKATFGQRLMQGLGYVGDFMGAVNQTPEGTPAILSGLGALGNRYNMQQYNQAQLKQQQDAMERARQAEEQQKVDALALINQYNSMNKLDAVTPQAGFTGTTIDPTEYVNITGKAQENAGNRAFTEMMKGNGLTPEVWATLNPTQQQAFLEKQSQNLTNMATLGKTSEALTAGAQAGGNVNTAGVPQSAITPAGKGDPFRQALGFVRQAEGGYANNPADKGGATNLGITQGTYNSWRKSNKLPSKDVKSITEGEATAIYKKNYWDASGAGKLAKTNPALAQVHFDTAVNMGVGRASQLLKMSGQDPNKYLAIRQQKYNEFAQNPSQKQFLEGWTNRNENLKKSIAGLQPQGKAPKSTVAQGNPQAQGQVMGSLNAYNTSPQLRRDAIQNPYQVAIADPELLMRGFGAGADTQNAVNNTNLNYRGQNIQQEQNKVSTALNYAQLAESKRQNDLQAKAQAQSTQARTEQAQFKAQQDYAKEQQSKIDGLSKQIDNLSLKAFDAKNNKQKQAIDAMILKKQDELGVLTNNAVPVVQGGSGASLVNSFIAPPQQAPKKERSPNTQPYKVNRSKINTPQ